MCIHLFNILWKFQGLYRLGHPYSQRYLPSVSMQTTVQTPHGKTEVIINSICKDFHLGPGKEKWAADAQIKSQIFCSLFFKYSVLFHCLFE